MDREHSAARGIEAVSAALEEFVTWQAAEGVPTPDRAVDAVLIAKARDGDGDLERWTAVDLMVALPSAFPPDLPPERDDVEALVRATRRYLTWLQTTRRLRGATLVDLGAVLDDLERELLHHAEQRTPLDRALGDLVVDLMELTGELPPVELPDRATLAAGAAEARLLRQATGLLAWVGEGRAVTNKGNLRLVDGRALVELLGTGDVVDPSHGGHPSTTRSTEQLPLLDLLYRLVLRLGWLEQEGGRVRPTARGRRVGEDPVDDWHELADALLDLGVLRHHWHDRPYAPAWGVDLDGAIDDALLDLLVAGHPREIERVAGEAWGVVRARFAVDRLDPLRRDSERSMVEWALRRWLDRLDRLGAVTVTGVEEEPGRFGRVEEHGGRVALTDLGRAWAHRRAVERGYEAPATGVFAAADPSLLGLLAALPPDQAADELLVWCRGRPAAEAEEVLLGLLVAGDLLPEPEGARAVVAALYARGAAALPVLEAIAGAHPDPAVGKDARRCLFRLRTAAAGGR
jgi:hypothetical protein